MDSITHDASGTASESVLERLSKTSPGLEIWWDSSPLVYERWVKELLEKTPPEKRSILETQLRRVYDPDNPGQTLFRGVTTNPPLSLAAMQDDPPRWSAWIKDFMAARPDAGLQEVFWALYKEIVRLGAEQFRPVFEESGYLYGHLSAQVDPRYFFDPDTMLAQALDLSKLGPNVMIKVPGTKEGIGVLKELTSWGIPTNCTAAYTVPQFMLAAEAILAGLEDARERGVDLTHWRSVVTYMSARWENSPAFEDAAQAAGVSLSAEDKRWAGVAIFKNAYRLFRQRAFPSKMLICSVRMGPEVHGQMHSWHLEETAGASAVFTLPPGFLNELFTQGEQLTFGRFIWKDIPAEVMRRLCQVPYFAKAYEPDGMTIDELNSLPPLLSTFKEFSIATDKMVAFVDECMKAQKEECLLA